MEKTKSHILLVDDDVDFLELSRKLLEKRGYRVVCCTELSQAWKRIEAEPPQLVITDLMMQTLHCGFDFAGRIKNDGRFSHIPVIIVSAVTSKTGFDFNPRGREDLQAMQAEAFFDKPVDPELLVAKIEELLP
jgi:CheY-like chemotaxis protein